MFFSQHKHIYLVSYHNVSKHKHINFGSSHNVSKRKHIYLGSSHNLSKNMYLCWTLIIGHPVYFRYSIRRFSLKLKH